MKQIRQPAIVVLGAISSPASVLAAGQDDRSRSMWW